MFRYRLITLFLLLFISISAWAATKGYRIGVHLSNSKDTVLYLAHYYGDKQYIDDTSRIDEKGVYTFEGNNNLPDGMYIIAGEKKNKYFDFFITGDQHIDFQCDPADIVGTMRIKNSPENKIFFSYIAFLAQKQKTAKSLQDAVKRFADVPDSLVKVRRELDAVNDAVKIYGTKLINEHPGYFCASFIKANIEPDIKPFLTNSEGKIDSTHIFETYRLHFFDNIDFQDPRLIYSPILTEKTNQYLDKLVLQNPDSLSKACDLIIQKCRVNKDVYKFMVWYLALRYEASEIMGFDAVFVYLVEKYYKSGLAEWLYPAVKDNILKRSDALKPLLIGKLAPNLMLMDTANQPVSLYAVKARYTLIFFWESTCGHCKIEMPKAIKLYQDARANFDLQVFAVSSDTSMAAWRKYIHTNNPGWINVNGNLSFTPNFHDLYDVHSTPVMYLLDEHKIIIAKRILSEQLGEFIKQYDKQNSASSKTGGG